MAEARAQQGHPTGLYVLFATEAWERFSYYGMRALLVLYLTKRLGFVKPDALALYGLYTGLVYLTPMFGGQLADKILGRRKAVIIGGVVMALGQFALTVPSLLYFALGLLIVGNGFFKPNISTIVGGLYADGDARRDSAFTIFYMGINLGALFSPLVCGTIGEQVSWSLGFGTAGIGMVAGLLFFIWGQRHLGKVGMPPGRGDQDKLIPKDWIDIAIWIVGSVATVVGVVYAWRVVGPVFGRLPVAGQLALAGVCIFAAFYGMGRSGAGAAPKEPFGKQGWQQIAVILILNAFVIAFWMGFEQAGGTMTLFADKQTDRHVSGFVVTLVGVVLVLGGAASTWVKSRGASVTAKRLYAILAIVCAIGGGFIVRYGLRHAQWEIPASYFQSINPFLIVLLAPAFTILWVRLDSSRFRTATPTKMAIGMIILGLGFVVMYLGQRLAFQRGSVGPQWLLAVYAIHTLGELCLSPIGLSMVTKLSPARVVSLMMGLWFTSTAVANYLAGRLEEILSHRKVPIYGFLVASSIGAGMLLLMLTPLLKKWMHGKA